MKTHLSPVRIALIYIFFSSVWILFSDSVLHILVQDGNLENNFQTVKGWLFITVTGGVLYWLVSRMVEEVKAEYSERKRTETKLQASEHLFKRLFENAEVSIWNKDLSKVYDALNKVRHTGVSDLRRYLDENEQAARDLVAMARVTQVNAAALKLFGADSVDDFLLHIDKIHGPILTEVFIDELCAIWDKRDGFRSEVVLQTLEGRNFDAIISFRIPETEDEFKSVPITIIDITNYKRNEEELRKLSRAVEQSPATIVITDTAGAIEYVNPKFESITGYSAEEVLGQNPRILKSGEKSREEYGELWKTIKSGGEWRGEFHNKRKDGTLYWEFASISPIKAPDGTITHFLAVKEDITERKRLENTAMHFGRIIEQSLNEIYVFDAHTLKFIQVNHGACTNLGFTMEELQELTPFDLMPQFSHDSFEQAICPLRDEDQDKIVFETVHRRKNGSRYDVEIHLQLMRDETPQVFVSIVQDITERKKAVRELAISNELKSTILEGALDAIITIDEQGKTVEFNRAAEEIFGYSRDQLVGKKIVDFIVPLGMRNNHKDGLMNFSETQSSHVIGDRVEMTAMRSGGGTFPIEITRTYLKKYALFTAFIRDLSGVKEAEEVLRRSQKMEAVGQLTGGIAHDFNNILSIVMGNLEILRNMVAGDEKALGRIEVALKGAKRGADLTRKLLGFSRQEAYGTRLISVNDLIKNMEELLTKSLTVAINVEQDLAGDLWPIEVDPGDLQDVILNLILNARDAMPSGGNLVLETANKFLDEDYVRHIPGSTPGEFVMVSVSDNGQGMTPEIKERVLEPFFSTKAEGKGTGLGLSMVYGFVQRSKGHIKIDSEPGSGTTFWIYLPRAQEGEKNIEAKVVTPVDLPRGSETILVVDDEEHLLYIAVHYLEGLGYKTLTANNGMQALRILEGNQNIDLLFSDVVMPDGMDGYKVAMESIKKRPSLKALLTSGFTKKHKEPDIEDKAGYARLSASLLSKPYNRTELAIAIRRNLDGLDELSGQGQKTSGQV